MRALLDRILPPSRSPVRYILLGHARTGSNVVAYSLRRHRAVEMFGEILHDDAEFAASLLPRRLRAVSRGDDPAAYLANTIFPPRMVRDARACGFKVFYDHARVDAAKSAWRTLIDDTDIRVIHLVRGNLLDARISLEIALRTGVWANTGGARGAPVAVEPFELSAWDCQSYFDRITTCRRWADDVFAHHPMLTLDYARDISGDQAATMARVFAFLGVRPMAVEHRLRRQRLATPQRQITNYAELRDWFRCSPYEHFFAPESDD